MKKYLSLALPNINSNIKVWLLFILKLLITIIFIDYIISLTIQAKLKFSFDNSNLYLILFALILSFINILLQFEKWKCFCSSYLEESNNLKIFRSLLIGFAAGLISPMRLGEHAGRVYTLGSKKALKTLVASIIDKLMSMIFIIFFGLLSLIFILRFDLELPSEIIISFSLIILSLTFFLAQLIFDSDFVKNYLAKKIAALKITHSIKGEFNDLISIDKVHINSALLYSILLQIIILLQFSILVAAFSNQYNLFYFMSAGALMLFTKSFFPSISFGDIGVRETASIFFLGIFNISQNVAVAASLLLFIFNALLPSILGAVLLFISKE